MLKWHLTIQQHAPGVKVGNDAAPAFSAQTLSPGSAPAKHTFQQPPIPDQNQNLDMASEARTTAEESIPGATSADVNRGIGQPIYGQSSHELRSDEKGRNGLVGVGADPRDPVRERGLDTDFPKDPAGKGGRHREDILSAEDKIPETAEAVAAERY